MTTSTKTFLIGGLLLCGLGLPKTSYAITGCNNSYLIGTYNAQVTSGNLSNVLNTLNSTATQLTSSLNGTGTSGTGTGTGTSGTGTTGTSGTGTTGTSGTGTTGTSGTGTTGTSGTGTTGTSGTGSTGSTNTTGFTGGFVGTGSSLNGNVPALGRYYFDGLGNIIGIDNVSSTASNLATGTTNAIVGTYTVNSDCTARMTLSSGQTYDAVLVNQGQQVLFLQADANGQGATGTLVRSLTTCSNLPYPQSYGFTYYGATPVTTNVTTSGTGTSGTGTSGTGTSGTGTSGTGTSGTGTSGTGTTGTSGTGTTGTSGTGTTGTSGTGTTGTSGTGTTGTSGTGTSGTSGTGSTTTTITTYQPYSTVGAINLDGVGNFTMTGWAFNNKTVQTINSRGTYTVGSDCSLSLSFTGGSTGSNAFVNPSLFRGLLSATSSTDRNLSSMGLLSVQPTSGVILTGFVIPQ